MVETMGESVVQEWLTECCSWKEQTVLLASLRGCDGSEKQDPSKVFARAMRTTLLKNADKLSMFYGRSAALKDEMRAEVDDFFIDCSRGNLDACQVSWLMHLLQAAEIVAYKCPHKEVADYWRYFNLSGVNALHINPESEFSLL